MQTVRTEPSSQPTRSGEQSHERDPTRSETRLSCIWKKSHWHYLRRPTAFASSPASRRSIERQRTRMKPRPSRVRPGHYSWRLTSRLSVTHWSIALIFGWQSVLPATRSAVAQFWSSHAGRGVATQHPCRQRNQNQYMRFTIRGLLGAFAVEWGVSSTSRVPPRRENDGAFSTRYPSVRSKGVPAPSRGSPLRPGSR